MSKKKNTLKDLDEFLKQQAATLVAPQKLSDRKVAAVAMPDELPPHEDVADISPDKIVADLLELSRNEGEQFPAKFYDLIIRSLELRNKFTPEDKMLINTALYLKNGSQWKHAIREYWKHKA
jgi:hypothetical protein